MKALLGRLHSRMGDFWWYSLMLFCACRLADLLNAFVGLWLVPKYVDPSELGAVTPLANFAGLLAMPVAVFAMTFRNEVSRLSIEREFGRLKTLIRTVFIAAGVFLFVAIVIARFTLPMFLARIRIVEGSLGLIIIATSFVTAVAPIFTNTIQALKKFKANAVMNLLGAPLRLLAMLVAMPFRPLAGYFVGQGASPAFNIVASVCSLRKELSVPAEPYWNREVVGKFSKLLAIFLVSGAASSLCTVIESTVLRQRLPDLDSAGYYMATRFSDISSFLYNTLVFTLFPFTAALAAKGKDMRPLILKAAAATIGFSALVALPFFFFGGAILSLLPHGEEYMAYGWAIPWQIGVSTLGALIGLYVTAETSANRFRFMMWMVPLDIFYPVLLLLVTGHGYFTGAIPASWTEFLAAHNIASLDTMLWWMTGFNAIKVLGCLVAMAMKGRCR
jgi:O-antigen/teichoic acid export membrane protein